MGLGKQKNKPRQNRYKKKASRPLGARLIGAFRVALKLGGFLSVLLSLSAACVAAYAAVTHCEYFRARTITVHGLSHLSRETVLRQAGLHEGDNMLAVNLGLVYRRLLAHPWIAAARVSRDVPAEISITVREQRPLAVVDLGRRYLLNQEGRLFKPVDDQDPSGLPLVTGMGVADISLGDDALTPALSMILRVLELCREPDSAVPYRTIETINLDASLGVSITQRPGQRRFKLGIEDFDSKFKELKRLLHHLENNPRWQDFRVVDISNPERIVVQLSDSEALRGESGGLESPFAATFPMAAWLRGRISGPGAAGSGHEA